MDAVLSIIMGILLFGSTFVLFVRTVEDIRNKRLPDGMASAAFVLAAAWLAMAVLGVIVVSLGVLQVIL